MDAEDTYNIFHIFNSLKYIGMIFFWYVSFGIHLIPNTHAEQKMRCLDMWFLMHGLIMVYFLMTGRYYLIWIPVVFIFLGLGGQRVLMKSNRNKCKHKHIINTSEYDYCYDCGEKVVDR